MQSIAYTTIFIRDATVGVEEAQFSEGISVHPNPGTGTLTVNLDNEYTGDVQISIISGLGVTIGDPIEIRKEKAAEQKSFETASSRTRRLLPDNQDGGKNNNKKMDQTVAGII